MPPVQADLVSGRGQARALDRQARSRKWDSGVLFVGDKGMLLSDYGKHVLLPEKEFADFKRPEPFDPEVARPPRRVDPRLQDRRADDLQLRVRRLADRGEPPRQRRLPRRQEARVGRRPSCAPRTPPRPSRSSAASTARAGRWPDRACGSRREPSAAVCPQGPRERVGSSAGSGLSREPLSPGPS